MSYVVDYGALDSLDSSIFSQCSQWQGQLSDMESAVSALMGTANLSGNSANNIKNYLKSVHGTVISLLGELIYLHSCNFKVYKSDYQAGVDTDLHAVIHSEKLTEIQEDLRTYRNQAASVDDQLAYVLRDVRDIFSIPHRDIYSADKANRIAENYVRELDQQIQQLEAAGVHVVVSDAQDIEGVYTAIHMIGELVGKQDEAASVVESMQKTFDEIKANAGDGSKTVYFEVSPLQYGLWTAGTSTFMDEIANMMGLKNCFADVTGWSEISEEQVLERNPDYIVTISMYYGEGPTPEEEILARPGWENVTAVKNGKILNLQNNELSRPAPRLAEGAQALYDFVYGE